MHAALQLGREFIGCDLAFPIPQFPADVTAAAKEAVAMPGDGLTSTVE